MQPDDHWSARREQYNPILVTSGSLGSRYIGPKIAWTSFANKVGDLIKKFFSGPIQLSHKLIKLWEKFRSR